MSDVLLILFGSAVCLLLIAYAFKFNKTFGAVNLLCYFLYSLPLYYAYCYQNNGGAALVWMFYLLALTALQLILIGGYLAYIKLFKGK